MAVYRLVVQEERLHAASPGKNFQTGGLGTAPLTQPDSEELLPAEWTEQDYMDSI